MRYVLALNERTGTQRGSEAWKVLEESALVAVSSMCKGMRGIQAEELAELLGLLSESPLSPESQARLRDTFNALLNEGHEPPYRETQRVDTPQALMT